MNTQPTKIARHPSGLSIIFEPQRHRYTDSRGCTYTSISAVLKSLFKSFDQQAIAARVAARENLPMADVLASWAAKSTYACRLGTRAHAVAEATVLARDHAAALAALTGDAAGGAEPESPRERAAFTAAWAAASQVRAGSSSVHPEVILADPDSLTAGTADLLAMRRTSTPDAPPSWTLCDYKTSEHIDTESRYGDRALPPFAHLHDCHLVRYSLQLHLYRWMLLNASYLHPDSPIALYIVHLAPDATEPAWMPALDLSAEAAAIMRARREDHATVLAACRGEISGPNADREAFVQ